MKILFVNLLFFCVFFFINGCATVPRQVPIGPSVMTHIIGGGETLYRIAKTYNVDINELMRVNKIVDPTQIIPGQVLIIPKPPQVRPYVYPIPGISIDRLVGPKRYFSRWHYITIHHSGTEKGSARSFDKYHRSRNMGGLFYHFVIGNGTLSKDGELEVGWRWRRQAQVNRPYDIQICLVGDFDKEEPTKAQMETLIQLINILRRHYNIPIEHIRRHKDAVNRFTNCPGKNFPFYNLLMELKKSKF